MRPIPAGARGSWSLVVQPDHLANCSGGALLPPVLASPVMIMAMENAALAAIEPYLERGESAVGTRFDVRHLAPTPEGTRVLAEARVTRVTGRRIEFWVTAADETGQIGTGTHERVVVDRTRMERHLAAKRPSSNDRRLAGGAP